MKIAILGTRGIPNNYGGFEQFAEYLSSYLANKGHEVYVYCSSSHPYQKSLWSKVNLIHIYDPENQLGTLGQFVYDLNCILDSRKRDFDIILQLGYTSNSIWGWLFSSKPIIVTNMDGLEWKRSKYSKPVQSFLKVAERIVLLWSDFLIADSIGIKEYLLKKYKKQSQFIPYGSYSFHAPQENVLEQYSLKPFRYNMLIARLEPENSIDIILNGASQSQDTFLVIGSFATKYGSYLTHKYRIYKNIKFLGAIYDIHILNNLRFFSNLYFHGHTVGGTNPSLLEAMGSQSLICAHNNIFNKAILEDDGYYFDKSEDVTSLIEKITKADTFNQTKVKNNLKKIEELYSWPIVNKQYEEFLISCLK